MKQVLRKLIQEATIYHNLQSRSKNLVFTYFMFAKIGRQVGRVCVLIRSCVRVFVCLCTRVFVCLCVRVSVCSCVRVIVCSCARVLVCSCARVLVCSCARVLVCSCASMAARITWVISLLIIGALSGVTAGL